MFCVKDVPSVKPQVPRASHTLQHQGEAENPFSNGHYTVCHYDRKCPDKDKCYIMDNRLVNFRWGSY